MHHRGFGSDSTFNSAVQHLSRESSRFNATVAALEYSYFKSLVSKTKTSQSLVKEQMKFIQNYVQSIKPTSAIHNEAVPLGHTRICRPLIAGMKRLQVHSYYKGLLA